MLLHDLILNLKNIIFLFFKIDILQKALESSNMTNYFGKRENFE